MVAQFIGPVGFVIGFSAQIERIIIKLRRMMLIFHLRFGAIAPENWLTIQQSARHLNQSVVEF